MVQTTHTSITVINGKWTIENHDEQIGTFLNNNSVYNEKRVLSNGDNIFSPAFDTFDLLSAKVPL